MTLSERYISEKYGAEALADFQKFVAEEKAKNQKARRQQRLATRNPHVLLLQVRLDYDCYDGEGDEHSYYDERSVASYLDDALGLNIIEATDDTDEDEKFFRIEQAAKYLSKCRGVQYTDDDIIERIIRVIRYGSERANEEMARGAVSRDYRGISNKDLYPNEFMEHYFRGCRYRVSDYRRF